MSTNQTKMYGVLALVIIVAGASLATLLIMQPPAENDIEPFVEVFGLESSLNFTLSELQAETAITRIGSYQNSFGNVRGYGEYQGVAVSDLIDTVGSIDVNDTITVKASDGYSQTFEYSKVYPNQTIWDIQGDMVIAYRFNGSLVPEYEDGFRLMFLPEDGYYSNVDANATTDPNPYAAGPQCVSNVVGIIVNQYTGPEPVLFSLQNETTTLRYTLSELQNLDGIIGEGGYKRNSGTIVGPDSYIGVSFLTLLNQFGSLPANYSVIVTAGDDWTSEYTKTVIDGTVNGYSPAGDPIGDITSTMILAYEMNGAPISAGDGGPLRVAFLNADGNLTDGSNWAKNVVNITIFEVPLSGGLQLNHEVGIDTSFNIVTVVLYRNDIL
ncbi:MAG: molybdopterin-dependent oxidoreductase [Candidatus Thorarchaeota archaeon]